MASPNTALEVARAAAAEAAQNFPACPRSPAMMLKYHTPEACLAKPSRPPKGMIGRRAIYESLREGGTGAALVPDTKTVVCPLETDMESLESPSAQKGFDTTWIVENLSTKPVVVAWVINGIEYSPFEPDKSPMEDPKAMLNPLDWTSVPTFESFVYHVREIEEDGSPGRVVLQHRAGMIPLGKKHADTENTNPDPEPFSPESVGTLDQKPPLQEVGRKETGNRPCNVIDIGFRNEAGFPLSVYFAANLGDVPEAGFSCAESYKFHMGLKVAPQDFMWDWSSQTKYEGSFLGHTFVARKADDPSVVVDKYTLEPTRIVDCPRRKAKPLKVALQAGAAVGGDVHDGESCPNDDASDEETTGDDEGLSSISPPPHSDQPPLSPNDGGGISSRAMAAGLSGGSGG